MTRRSLIMLSFVGALGLLLPLTPPAMSQDQTGQSQEDTGEDAGFLERQIQNVLGGEGRTVRVSGLSGLLSSQASIDLIEVSDDDGIWLTIRDIVLDWRRLALLRGRLEVDALTVGAVNVARKPLPGPASAPALTADQDAEPKGFSLPELPVSVNVRQLSLGSLMLGEPVIGQTVNASINGSANLADGEGAIDIALVRIDGKQGSVRLNAGFENETRRLYLDFNVEEEQGGLVASLSGMPGQPELKLNVSGDAPLSDFTAQISLKTDDTDRLTGTVELRDEPATTGATAQVIAADLSGDIAVLFLPDYRNFFGRNVEFKLRATQVPEVGLTISQLDLMTNGMSLSGTAALSPAFLPISVDLKAHLGQQATGLPVTLPLPGPAVTLQKADLEVTYDEANGDDFTLSFIADGLQREDGLLLDQAEVSVDGALRKSGPVDFDGLAATLSVALSGFSHTDVALWDAVGDDASLAGQIDWTNRGALQISDLKVEAGDVSLAGTADIDGLQSAKIAVDATLAAKAGDLDRFSAISGQSLAGAITADLTTNYDVNSGAFDVDLTGKTQDLAIGDDAANDLLAGAMDLNVKAARTADGIALDTLILRGGSIDLTGSADIAPSGWPRKVEVTGRIGSDSAAPVSLPGLVAKLQSVDIDVSYDARSGDDFKALIDLKGFDGFDMTLAEARIQADGQFDRSGADDPVSSAVAAITSSVIGFSHTDAALAQAVGEGFDLAADLDWENGGDLTITDLRATSGDLSLTGSAQIGGLQQDAIAVAAKLKAAASDLSRFSAISGQQLGGAIGADLTASYDLPSGNFDIDLTGKTQDLSVGETTGNDLLAGSVDLALQAAKTDEGTELSKLSVKGDAVELTGTASIGPDNWPRKVDVAGTVGTGGTKPVTLPIPGPLASLLGATIDLSYDEATGDKFKALIAARDFSRDGLGVSSLRLSSDGEIVKGSDGALIASAKGTIAALVDGFTHPDPGLVEAVGKEVSLDAAIDWVNGGVLSLSGLRAAAGNVTLSGDATVDGLQGDAVSMTAKIAAKAGDLDRFSKISGQTLGGEIAADVSAVFNATSGHFDVDFSGQTQDLSVGQESANDLLAGRVDINVKADRDDEGTQLSNLAIKGQAIDIAGTALIAPDNWPSKVDIAGGIGSDSGAPVALPIPGPGPQALLQKATIDLSYDAAQQETFKALIAANGFSRDGVTVGTLSLTADGSVDRGDGGTGIAGVVAKIVGTVADAAATDPEMNRALTDGADLTANVDWTVDENVLNISDLDLTSGEANVTATARIDELGTAAMTVGADVKIASGPIARFSGLAGRNLSGSLDANTTADFAMETGYFDVDMSAVTNELRIGQADVDQLIRGEAQLVLDLVRNEEGFRIDKVDLTTPQLTLAATGGTVSGQTSIDLNGRLANVGQFAPGFNGPLVLAAKVDNQGDTWTIDSTLDGPGGSRIAATGDAWNGNGEMDLRATGTLPLGLVNRSLSPRSIQGNANFDITVNGPPGLDAVAGTLTVLDARLVDPATRLALENLKVNVGIANASATLDVGANLSTGGRLSVSGPITLTGDIPADITITLDKLTLLDPTLFETSIDGEITFQGPVTGGAAIAGRIDIGRTEIKIPSSFGGPGAIPDIRHLSEPGASLITRERAGLVQDDESGNGGGGGPVYLLDLLVSAPNEIFIRGRGLEAELGGEINIGGTTAAPVPSGDLDLIRGRMSLLSQNLEFEEATVSFQGSLMPNLRMVAVSDNGTINAQIIIDGPISDPEITLQSDPELPEDEVLAQLFFGKPIADLTPVEVVQLAGAINELSGGSGGLFGRLRDGLGVDQLNVSNDSDGTTSVSAGKYISEKIYTDVTVGSDGTSEIQLNYEIRKNFTARGSFDNNGNTAIGLSFETDY